MRLLLMCLIVPPNISFRRSLRGQNLTLAQSRDLDCTCTTDKFKRCVQMEYYS
jgi:hypothetical protein